MVLGNNKKIIVKWFGRCACGEETTIICTSNINHHKINQKIEAFCSKCKDYSLFLLLELLSQEIKNSSN